MISKTQNTNKNNNNKKQQTKQTTPTNVKNLNVWHFQRIFHCKYVIAFSIKKKKKKSDARQRHLTSVIDILESSIRLWQLIWHLTS